MGFSGTLAAMGLLMILSASSLDADATYGNAMHFVTRQLVGLLMGSALSAVVLSTPWRFVRKGAWFAYIMALVSLALVMSPLGHSAKGAARWIQVGPINVQPSEFAKVALVLGVLSNVGQFSKADLARNQIREGEGERTKAFPLFAPCFHINGIMSVVRSLS
jgi:cell division protein FtsW (lipid II flippase)